MHCRIIARMLWLLVLPILLFSNPARGQTSTYTVLHHFAGPPNDGCKPQGDLLRDSAGNLYGTTADCGSGSGTIFMISAAGKEILYKFTGKNDGGNPEAGLVRDAAGNFYGTTDTGGSAGDGVVFKIAKSKVSVLHTFSGPDGAHPVAALVVDHAGNLYGTTFYGGTASCSCGTVFKIDTSGNESVLYSFTGGADGKFPAGRLLLDSAGNLYGTASEGGVTNCDNGIHSCGVVFEISPTGQETVLYTFSGNGDGGDPVAGLVRDVAGNLYGTTFEAGDNSRNCAVQHGCGVVFELSPTGQETVLYTFTNGADGANPAGDLILDPSGNIWGTTQYGGSGYGVIFEITGGAEYPMYTFDGTNNGADPLAGLIRDSSGNFYGTTSFGGYGEEGVVFKFTP